MPRGRKPRMSTGTLAAIASLSAADWGALEAIADLGLAPTRLLEENFYGSRKVRERRWAALRRAGIIDIVLLTWGRTGRVSFSRLGPAGKRALAARGRVLGPECESLEMCCAVAPDYARLIAEAYMLARRLATDAAVRMEWTPAPPAPEGAWAVLRLEPPEGRAATIAFIADVLPWSPAKVSAWLAESKRRAGVLVATDPGNKGAEKARLADPEARRFVARRPTEAVARAFDALHPRR